MPTLAQRLPYLHPFAGGYPYRGSQRLPSDPDALAYLAAVAAADGAPVEVGVAMAVDDFFKGCKADPSGIPGRSNWDAIKASCLLCGARTLAGALVPLKNEGPELWDMENVPTPTILDGDGSAGAWDAATLTFSNENSSGNAARPRFTFPVSTTAGKSYYISGRFSGDYTDVSRVSLGTVDGATTFVDGVFSGTASDASGNLSIYLNGTLGPSAVTIESLSIREVIAAPTNNNFVDADYNRETGLKGNGSTKFLNSNRASGPQDNEHLSIYQTSVTTGSSKAIAGAGLSQDGVSYFFNISTTNIGFRQQTTSFDTITGGNAVGFVGMSRSSSLGYSASAGGSSQDFTQASQTLFSANHSIFTATTNTSYSDARLAFYSIGESISDLALLDARVTALVQRIQLSLSTGLDASGYDDATVAYLLAAYNNGATLA